MDCEEIQQNEATKANVDKSVVLKFDSASLTKRFLCTVCPVSYTQITNLKYHVRREHFNLLAQIFMRERRKMKEVWLERVLNSESIVEMEKSGHNKYLMRKSNKSPEDGEVAEAVGYLDMSPLYPDLGRMKKKNVQCGLCHESYERSKYIAHVQEEHDDVVL